MHHLNEITAQRLWTGLYPHVALLNNIEVLPGLISMFNSHTFYPISINRERREIRYKPLMLSTRYFQIPLWHFTFLVFVLDFPLMRP